MATVRYLVSDVAKAIAFYENLGFDLEDRMLPAFARMRRFDLDLWIAGPGSSAARPLADDRQPRPGGWNRFVIEVDQLEFFIEDLHGVTVRHEIVSGPGGRQVLIEDPDGNVVELFEARR